MDTFVDISSMSCCSVIKYFLTLWDPMNCSLTGLCALHCLLEFVQSHVHWVSDAMKQSHPLSSLFPPALNLSQNQSLFQWIGCLYQIAKLLQLQFQHQKGSEVKVGQSCLTPHNSMDYTVHRILQLEYWNA